MIKGALERGLNPLSPSAPSLPRLDALRPRPDRSEEHTSELQSQSNLVCRLLLEKKKNDTPVAPKAAPGRRRRRCQSTPARVRFLCTAGTGPLSDPSSVAILRTANPASVATQAHT